MDSFARGLLIALMVLALVAVSGPAMMGGMMGPAGMSWGSADLGGWHRGMLWDLGGLTMLAFWGALVVGWCSSSGWSSTAARRPPGHLGESAEEALRRRYAAGEITREQFEQDAAGSGGTGHDGD